MGAVGYSPRELAQALGISQNHVYLLIAQGRLRAVRLGRRWVIPRHELSRLGLLPEAVRERGEERQ